MKKIEIKEPTYSSLFILKTNKSLHSKLLLLEKQETDLFDIQTSENFNNICSKLFKELNL